MRIAWWKPVAALGAAMGLAGATLPAYVAATGAKPASVTVDARVLSVRHGTVPVIVQKLDSTDRRPEAQIRLLGGTVSRELPIVNGFAATVPATAAARLGALTG